MACRSHRSVNRYRPHFLRFGQAKVHGVVLYHKVYFYNHPVKTFLNYSTFHHVFFIDQHPITRHRIAGRALLCRVRPGLSRLWAPNLQRCPHSAFDAGSTQTPRPPLAASFFKRHIPPIDWHGIAPEPFKKVKRPLIGTVPNRGLFRRRNESGYACRPLLIMTSLHLVIHRDVDGTTIGRIAQGGLVVLVQHVGQAAIDLELRGEVITDA